MKKNLLIFLIVFLYICAVSAVVLSAWVKGCEDFLAIATKENGFFESIGAFILILMSFIGFKWLYENRLHTNKYILFGIGLFSLVAFLACMEEISWGQHLFHFGSGDFFKTHNYQQEINFHNLMPASIFSSIVYFCVYSFYVFIPLLTRLLAQKIDKIHPFLKYLPPLHVTLIILFASSFQAYFYDDFGVWADTCTLICGMILFISVAKTTNNINKWIIIHYLFILTCIITYMVSYRVFSFFNLQYEIRETFVVFGTFIYFLYLLPLL